MSTNFFLSVVVSFVKIGAVKIILYLGGKEISIGTFDILLPIWAKFRRKDLNITLLTAHNFRENL